MPDEYSDEQIDEILDSISEDLDSANWEIWASVWSGAVSSYYFNGDKNAIIDVAQDLGTEIKQYEKSLVSKAASNDRAMAYFDKHGTELVKHLSETDKKRLKKLIKEEWPKGKEHFVNKAKDSFFMSESRLETIYRTETHTAYEAARYEVQEELLKEAKNIRKVRIMHHSGNPNPRIPHLQADGEVREFGDPFSFGQLYPAAPRCTCWAEYKMVDKAYKIPKHEIKPVSIIKKPTVPKRAVIKPTKIPKVHKPPVAKKLTLDDYKLDKPVVLRQVDKAPRIVPPRTAKDPKWWVNDTKVAQDAAKQTKKIFDEMPIELTCNVKDITLLDKMNKADVGHSKLWGKKVVSEAGVDLSRDRCNLISFSNEFGQEQAMRKGVMAHELAHTIDNGLSNKLAWKNRVNKDGMWVSQYSKKHYELTGSLSEDFADSVNLFITDRKLAYKLYPNRAEYISRKVLKEK